MMSNVSIITGAAGGIGRALCTTFASAGYDVIAVDIRAPKSLDGRTTYVELDLNRYCSSPDYRSNANRRLRDAVGGRKIAALVNNAAIQIVKPVESLTADDWTSTLHVNLLAPFLLTQSFLKDLEVAAGAVVNIASIHATLTKPEFVAYATSKAAFVGMTRSMAVELGKRVRVNAICPAAIDTDMLRAGFEGKEHEFRLLEKAHPTGSIGTPDDVAKLAVFLASSNSPFLTGGVYSVDGAIGSRLHDPV